MKTALTLILALIPAPLFADNAFEKMLGSWNGGGTYTEGIAEVKLRCKISITGDANTLHMSGRCGSSLGAENFTMDFALDGNRNVSLRRSDSSRGEGSNITGLSGPLGNNGMVVTGRAAGEEVVVQLLLNDNGTLVFATREIAPGHKNVSYVTLSR